MGVRLRHGAAVGMAFALLLNACGMQPYQNPDRKKRPGIFSGPDGEWVIFRKHGPLPGNDERRTDTDGDDVYKPPEQISSGEKRRP